MKKYFWTILMILLTGAGFAQDEKYLRKMDDRRELPTGGGRSRFSAGEG